LTSCALTKPFDDPHYAPPADLTDAEARAYEEVVLATIREAVPRSPYVRPSDNIRPGRWVQWIIESVDLEGQRPETAVVFTYREVADRGRLLAARRPVWEGLVETVSGRELLDSAHSLAGHIFSDFTARELEPYEVD
jgi:hypothetical protein